jgi:hypothetical protein
LLLLFPLCFYSDHIALLPLFLPFWLLLLSNTVVCEFQWGVMIAAQLAKTSIILGLDWMWISAVPVMIDG